MTRLAISARRVMSGSKEFEQSNPNQLSKGS
jgi:hypothetical protein